VYICAVDERKYHELEDGSYYFEIDGIPEHDSSYEEDDRVTAAPFRETKVKFSFLPIRVNIWFFWVMSKLNFGKLLIIFEEK